MPQNPQWPDQIFIVRHGQSAGNVARDAAEAAGHFIIEMKTRDVDIPLSDLGERQASALGRWIAAQPETERPTVVLSSPYVRAKRTAELILAEIGPAAPKIIQDERLREREFGGIDGLTRAGIIDKFPAEAEAYGRLGKFYYRPPGGESWTDVILRLRSVLDSLSRDYAGERVLIVCHTVVVMCLRYLFEELTEAEILKIDRENMLGNCSLTSYRSARGGKTPSALTLDRFNFVAPLEEAGEKVTRKPDVAGA